MNHDFKRATIHDVAKAAQTSIATVSRVMSNSDYPVSEQLRQKIKEEARRLKYIPNSSATKSYRKATSQDIGVIIPNISNQFYAMTLLGIESVARQNGYNIVLFNSLNDAQKETEYLDILFERSVKGVILSSVKQYSEDVQFYLDNGMKFVLLDQKLENIDCPTLHFDSKKGAKMAVGHLYDMGHRKIAFATTPLTRTTRKDIYRGYTELLAEKGIKPDDELFFSVPEELVQEDINYETSAGRYIAQQFVTKKCDATAILCINDMLAIGVIKELGLHGIRVPEDVSVIGFDDIPLAQVYLPGLTTIRYPSYETGKLAALLLLQSMNDSSLSLKMKLEPEFVERQSVCKPNV